MTNDGHKTSAARNGPAHRGGLRGWQRWTPFAAVAWSLAYAALGAYWALNGRGFPYARELVSDLEVLLYLAFSAFGEHLLGEGRVEAFG